MDVRTRRFVLLGCLAGIVGLFGWQWWQERQAAAAMSGIVHANGRLEAIQVNISTKEAGRVLEITVKEGDMVNEGQVVAQMDIETLNAELAKVKADLAETEASVAVAKSTIAKRESELKLSQQNFERQQTLFNQKVVVKADFDRSESDLKSKTAALDEERGKLDTLMFTIKSKSAEVKRTQTRIDDSTLTSPVKGRVLYRLTEPGEVLPSGGKVLTLVNLTDVYMEIFLPAQEAALVQNGADARITLDAKPGYAAAAKVSFVSPEAQFTPKQVETRSERDKLMFRVKIQVPPERMLPYIERIKTGIRGEGYIKIDKSAVWPAWLENQFPLPQT